MLKRQLAVKAELEVSEVTVRILDEVEGVLGAPDRELDPPYNKSAASFIDSHSSHQAAYPRDLPLNSLHLDELAM